MVSKDKNKVDLLLERSLNGVYPNFTAKLGAPSEMQTFVQVSAGALGCAAPARDYYVMVSPASDENPIISDGRRNKINDRILAMNLETVTIASNVVITEILLYRIVKRLIVLHLVTK